MRAILPTFCEPTSTGPSTRRCAPGRAARTPGVTPVAPSRTLPTRPTRSVCDAMHEHVCEAWLAPRRAG
jgi:hypothetical protein